MATDIVMNFVVLIIGYNDNLHEKSKKYAKIRPKNPKGEITKITNSQNTKRIYGQPS